MVTLIEYDGDSKPTGRLCRLPDETKDSVADLLPLYGVELTLNRREIRYSAERFIFIYGSAMSFHGGDQTDLEELLA